MPKKGRLTDAINNAAEEFISKNDPVNETAPTKQPEKESTPETQKTAPDRIMSSQEKAPAGYKMNPEYIELKSQRLQLLIQPSTGKRLKEYAKKNNISTNEAANRAFIYFLENNK